MSDSGTKGGSSASVPKRFYDKSNKLTEPHCIYYYHFTPTAGVYDTKAYYVERQAPISKSDLLKIVESLAINAHEGDFVPPPCGGNMRSFSWRRKSYLVVLLDDPNSKFKKKDEGGAAEIKDNHTFFDGEDFEVNVSRRGQPQKRSAFWCINHMMDSSEQDLGVGVSERFEFEFNDGRAPFYPSDSGTNVGPPVGPP